jgi:hypothetical protein
MEWTIKLEARSGRGEVETIEVSRLKRRLVGLTADEVGLTLAEGKDLLSELQRLVLQTQMEEYVMCARVCRACLTLRRRRDRRTRTIQTLFGTVEVDAPRISICPCSNEMGFVDLSFSPLAQLFPDRCTPELRRIQAELGARHSFREAAQLLSTLLPCSPTNHATIRNRTHRIAVEIEAAAPEAPKDVLASNDEMVVMLDGAHIRAAPGYQTRHVDVTVGKVEVTGRRPRRFALAPKGSDHPLAPIRAALVEQGWHSGRPLAVISDGEAALPNLVRAATGEPVRHILDWFHLSMRIRPIEQVLTGLSARRLHNPEPVQAAQTSIERIRHLLWHGRQDQADQEIVLLMGRGNKIAERNGVSVQEPTNDLTRLCTELKGYAQNARDAIVNYHRRYHGKRPISSSRAEGCVDEITNARMRKKQRMRRSPRGAHRVALVRAAVLDGRLKSSGVIPLAA